MIGKKKWRYNIKDNIITMRKCYVELNRNKLCEKKYNETWNESKSGKKGLRTSTKAMNLRKKTLNN